MIKITYETLAGPDFQAAFQKIMNAPMDGKSAYMVKKIYKEVKAGRDQISEEFKKEIQEAFGQKDSEGKIDHTKFVVAEGKQDEYKKAVDDFEKRVIEVKRPKLTMKDISAVQLSPFEQLAIEDILDDSAAEKSITPPNLQALQRAVG